MANFSDLPSEIWHLIAQYLRGSQLSELKCLNSFFLNYCMDLKWKRVRVQINDFDPKESCCFLQRLILPFIAPRTKVVTVNLVTSLTDSGALGHLLDSLPLLPNLTCLNIYYPTFHLDRFFQIITSSSLRMTLHELSVTGRVEMFSSIQQYCAHESPFDNLTKLNLELHGADDDEDPQLESSLALEPFLRSLAPTLQSLMITSMSFTLDFSHLFNGLSKPDSLVLFSNLMSLSFYLRFNTSFAFPQSLHHFLRTNNHLQHLHLGMYPSHAYPEDEEALGAWLADLVDNVHFPSLQTLDIYPSNTEIGLSAFLSLIKLTVPTLTSLIVSGPWLKPGMANQVIDALTECEGQPKMLSSLTLKLAELSVPFLELVARKLPHLKELTLWQDQLVGSGQDSFHDLLRKRRYNRDSTSTQDVFHTWKLQDLKVYGDSWDESAIRGCCPSLRLGEGYG